MAQSATQQFLEMKDIREGTLILKNNSIRGVIMVSSLNFALKSEEEQQGIIYQFQNFLNSLDFSLEIVVQSRVVNITGYLDKLSELEKNQQSELMKIQTAEYRKFIENLIAGGQILSKNFFVVVPFFLLELPGMAKSDKKKNQTVKEMNDEQFQRARAQLWQRIEFVSIGLRRCGLQCVPLKTSELIELFWSWYHPDEAEIGYYPEIPEELIH